MNLTDRNIPYENLHRLNLEFEDAFKKKLNQVLEKNWYILGDEVKSFEENFASYCGSRFCVGVGNGLDALELGLKAFDFPGKSEIIVPSNTYIATILAIINSGHIPVLIEPDIKTYNINPALIEEKINKKTKAILVVHLYGQVAQVHEIVDIAQKYNLEILEDCAQAHGALFQNQMVGTFGKIGAFSFYPSKNLGALGDAGGIITSDEKLYTRLRALRNYGSEKKYYNKYIGRNSRLDEIQAAFLNVKLPFLNKINEHKIKLAAIYDKELTNQVIKPIYKNNFSHVYHIYNIRTGKRDELKTYLLQHGIGTEIHYPVSPNMQEGYSIYFKNLRNPISEEIHSTTLSLPISYATSTEEVYTVCAEINKFFQ